MSFTTDAARWRALTIRDATANGRFVYSVKSTNIYCRPTCPARLARRANVGFYNHAAEAEAAGYRPCKRCKPETEITEDPQERAVIKACNLIEEALKENDPKSFRLQDLAKNVGLTPRYFHKIFKDKTGLTPKEYAKVKQTEYSISASTSPGNESQPAIESFNFEDFDFNELVDLDPTLPFNGHFQPADQAQLFPSFGNDIDVNIRTEHWDGTYSPNSLDSGFDDAFDKHNTAYNATSDSSGWEYEAMTTAVSTFEMDAAAVLSASRLADIFPDFSMEDQRAALKLFGC